MTPGRDFGEEVRVADEASPALRPGSRAWIVGLPTAQRNYFIIEFEDGSSTEAPPEALQRST